MRLARKGKITRANRNAASRPKSPAKSRSRPLKAAHSGKKDPLDALIDAAAAALDLPIDPAWKRAIKAHLQVTLNHASQVGEFVLPDDAEPAPIFKA